MKKALALLLALMTLGAACAGAANRTFELRFEDGFSLALPQGWVAYPPAADDGVRYALGDGEGRYLYILAQPSEFGDAAALQAALARRTDCEMTGALDLNGQPSAAFIAAGLNAGGCATLLGGRVFVFLFTPQDDADFMQLAAQIMASFRLETR